MEIALAHPLQLALLGVGLVFFGNIALRNPRRAAQLVVFLLPTYLLRVRQGPLPTNVLELLILVFFVAVAVRIIFRKERLTSPPRAFWLPLTLLALGGTVSAVAAVVGSGYDPETTRTTLGALKGFLLEPVLFVLLLTSLPHSDRSSTSVIRAYVWSVTAVAGTALLGGLVTSHLSLVAEFLTYDGRLRGFYESPNQLAMYILPAAALLLAGGGSETARNAMRNGAKGPSFFARALLALMLLSALIWTQSAGAFLGLATALLLYAVSRKPYAGKQFSLYAIRYTLYALVMLGLLVPFIGAQFADTAWEEGWRSPGASRTMIWRAGVELLKTDGLLGIGPGMFQERYLALQEQFPPYLEWAVPHPHNLVLAVWLSTGVLGFVGFTWLIVGAFRRIQNPEISIQVKEIAISMALMAILTHGLVDTTFLKNDLGIVLLLFIATRY